MNTNWSQELVGRVLDRGQFDVPAVAAVSAAIGDDVADEPLAVLAGWSEQVARAAAVDADDLFCRRLGQCAQVVFVHDLSSLARCLVVTPIHMSRLRAGIA